MNDAHGTPFLFPHDSSKGSSRTLESLGIEQEVLMDAVRAGVVRASGITSFHPTTARGFVQWSETVASLRQDLDNRGWKITNPKNSPRITSPDGQTTIMVIGGNEDTGVSEDLAPQVARRRGPSTHAAVEANDVKGGSLRGGIQGVLDIVLEMPRIQQQAQNWVLLYHWSTKDLSIRAELSLPAAIEDGMITSWGPRIFLPAQGMEGLDFDIMPQTSSPQDDVDFRIVELS